MSIRNLESLFRPKSVALIGGTDNTRSVSGLVTRNLVDGGFSGSLFMVNLRHDEVLGYPVYRRVGDLPQVPELGVIAIPPKAVPGVVRELGAAGAKAAVVISAGFAELGTDEGRALQQAALDAARPYNLRLLGPNCVGMLAPHRGINASFSHLPAQPGKLACVSQSGAILTAMLDWAEANRIGFSAMVSLGNAADIDAGDLLDYLALDAQTHAILLYVEGVRSARKFMSAARVAARSKHVIVVKSGRHPGGARAAASHTAALAGADDVTHAAFRRAGMLRVRSLEELFDAAEVLSMSRRPRGNRAAVLTNGGGVGVLAADALQDEGAQLAELGEDTVKALDGVLPSTWSRGNPVDIIGDASPERYAAAMAPLQSDPGVDVLLALNAPTALASSRDAAVAVADQASAAGIKTGPVLVTSWIGEHEGAKARELLAERRIPSYATPDKAVRAFMYLDRFRRNQESLMETPPSIPEDFTPDRAAAQAIVRRALDAGREWLDEIDAKALLRAYEIPAVASRRVATAAEAGEAACAIGEAVAIKVLSPDILHKSEVGGVLLEVDPANAERAAGAMLERLRREHPQARIEGLSVQAMVERRDAWELLAGIGTDPVFGPFVVFGEGGEAVELIEDRSIGLPPLNMHLANDLVERTRIDRRLRGYRHREAADREALCFALVKLAQLVADMGEVTELDINPLIASPKGVVALDARVRLRPFHRHPAERLAIRPYPSELESTVRAKDGEVFDIRPIRPDDEPRLQALFKRLTPEEIRFRFMGPVRVLTHHQAARFAQLDYDREMALALVDRSDGAIHGVVRISTDPDRTEAEYAILVVHDIAGRGLGTQLMQRIIDYSRAQGLQRLTGHVLADNTAMLDLCRRLGFSRRTDPEERGVVEVQLDLNGGDQ